MSETMCSTEATICPAGPRCRWLRLHWVTWLAMLLVDGAFVHSVGFRGLRFLEPFVSAGDFGGIVDIAVVTVSTIFVVESYARRRVKWSQFHLAEALRVTFAVSVVVSVAVRQQMMVVVGNEWLRTLEPRWPFDESIVVLVPHPLAEEPWLFRGPLLFGFFCVAYTAAWVVPRAAKWVFVGLKNRKP